MVEDILVSEEVPENWDEDLLKFDNAHIYNSFAYAKVMQRTFSFKPIFFKSENAMLLGFEQSLKGVAGVLGKGFIAFAPPVFRNSSDFIELIDLVENECKKRKLISLTIWTSPLWDNSDFFKTFESVEMCNVVLQLKKSEEALFNSLEHAARKNLSKVKSLNSNVYEGTFSDIEDYYSNYKKHHESIGLEVYPKEYFDALYNEIIEKNFGKFFVLRDLDNVFCAGLMIGALGKSTYELSISSNWEKRQLFPNDVLKWHAIKWANNNGFEQFDLSNIAVNVEEGSKESNVNRFKKKFGSEVSYHAYKKKFGVVSFISKLKKN